MKTKRLEEMDLSDISLMLRKTVDKLDKKRFEITSTFRIFSGNFS